MSDYAGTGRRLRLGNVASLSLFPRLLRVLVCVGAARIKKAASPILVENSGHASDRHVRALVGRCTQVALMNWLRSDLRRILHTLNNAISKGCSSAVRGISI